MSSYLSSGLGTSFRNMTHNIADRFHSFGDWIGGAAKEANSSSKVRYEMPVNISLINKVAYGCLNLSDWPRAIVGQGFKFIGGVGSLGATFVDSGMGKFVLGAASIGGAAYGGIHIIRTNKKVIVKETVRDARHPYGVDYLSFNRGELLRLLAGVSLVATSTLALWGSLYRFGHGTVVFTEPVYFTPASQPAPAGG